MAYAGYLIKIGGTTFSNANIVVPSYKIVESPIEIFSYYDQTYGKHITQANKTEKLLSFTLRQLKAQDYANAISVLGGTSALSIQYYDAKTNAYKTGTFKRTSKINGSIWRIQNGTVWMNAEEFTFEEVAG